MNSLPASSAKCSGSSSAHQPRSPQPMVPMRARDSTTASGAAAPKVSLRGGGVRSRAASGLSAALQRTNNRLARHRRCTAIRARGRAGAATRPLIARPTGRQDRGSELAASAICSGRPEAPMARVTLLLQRVSLYYLLCSGPLGDQI
jgi:hypothetical protein